MAKRHKTGSRPEVEIVRLRMQSLDAPIDMIAAEISRQYGHRTRQAYRLAHGWNQTEAAQAPALRAGDVRRAVQHHHPLPHGRG